MAKFIFILVLIASRVFLNAQNYSSLATTSGTLSISVTTSGTGGKYAPEHVLAIWIQDNSNKYVKTLLANAAERKNYLTNWKAVNSTFDITGVDATSGATKTSFGTRTCIWNGTNSSGNQVVDGTYYVKMELTDKNATGNLGTFAFSKGTTAVNLTPTNVPSFSNISITWQPAKTGINNIELSTLYSIYPNPAISNIYVNGPDIQSIDVFTLEGKRVFSSNQQKLNINTLKKGTYLLNINTGKGLVSKKLIKN